jgi:hypothetical protein
MAISTMAITANVTANAPRSSRQNREASPDKRFRINGGNPQKAKASHGHDSGGAKSRGHN